MYQPLFDAFYDSLKMLPILFIVYLSFELLERRSENWLTRALTGSRISGPLFGAIFGCIPQCGFSVLATALWAHKTITPGTLLSVYLSTSDEAIPLLLARPDKAYLIAPILSIKIGAALVAGYTVDFFFHFFKDKTPAEHTHASDCHCHEELHCCGDVHSTGGSKLQEFILKPLRHAGRVFLFILAVSLLINISLYFSGSLNPANLNLISPASQIFISVLIGLIPNCAASVAITQFLIEGSINLAAASAGLCASTGLGLIVLFRESRRKSDAFLILTLLVCASLLTGLAVQLLL